MEEILGGRTDPERFESFLENWRPILARRVAEVGTAFAKIAGVSGLILAGGVGRDQPWPLSDIDLLPVYEDERAVEARAEVERLRLTVPRGWLAEGWRTGLDVGKLWFTRSEAARAIGADNATLTDLLQNDRWYHGLDKGFQGRALVDKDGSTTELSGWLTTQRFTSDVITMRLERERRELESAVRRLDALIQESEPLAMTTTLHAAVKWLRIWLLEQWGERDNSLARIGTRFDRLARERGLSDIADGLNEISDLNDTDVTARMATAPDWVWDWHDRSWRARKLIGETVTPAENERDVLRVCALYELRQQTAPPFPSWLGVIDRDGVLRQKTAYLSNIMDSVGLQNRASLSE